MTPTDRSLGMQRAISRSDFINGAGVALAGALVPFERALAADTGSRDGLDPYPPRRTGMRGSHAGSFEAGHRLRD